MKNLPAVPACAQRAWAVAVFGVGTASLLGLSATLIGLSATLTGCQSPLPAQDDPAVLRAALLEQHAKQRAASAQGQVIELTHQIGDAEKRLTDKELIEEIQASSGALTYQETTPSIQPALDGSQTQFAPLSLHEAVRTAVENNIDLQIARLVPAVSRAQLLRAEATFDAIWFAEASHQDLDAPENTSGLTNPQTLTTDIRTGIRQPLTTGGQVSVEIGGTHNQFSSDSSSEVDYYTGDLTLQVVQPLLRGFGTDINTASIAISRNAVATETQELKNTLLQLAAQTEQAYWNLVFAHQTWRIQSTLLEREIAERDRLMHREDLDLSPAAASELYARAARQKAIALNAEENVRQASRQLKRLLNSDEISLSDLTIIQPTENPSADAMQFDYHDAMQAALNNRPEINQAILSIQDATIRQRVADNNRLPQLDASAAVRFQGFDDSSMSPAVGDSADIFDNDYVDYIFQLSFEQPIGNRDAEGLMAQRRFERQAAVKDYQRTVQDIQLELQNTLGTLRTQFQQISARYNARIAAADSLRAINEQEKSGVALSPEFVSEKLNRLESLASAEIEEAQAHADYNNAITELYRVMGTLLDRNQISFDPTPAPAPAPGRS